MLDRRAIEDVGRRVIAAATSPARVIAFGSVARGEAGPDSDLDLLVIERDVDDVAAESARLRRVVGNIGVPVDLIVFDEALAARRAVVPGTLVHSAMREGWVVAES